MQIACNWTLGEYDLRALGCIGVFLADNESLAETAARRSDLAILDRMVTMRITANDTSWRHKLAAKYRTGTCAGCSRCGRRSARRCASCCRRAPSTTSWPTPRRDSRCAGGFRWSTVSGCASSSRAATADRGRTGPRRCSTASRPRSAYPTRATIPDPVRQVVRAALRNRWTVLLQGPPGCGKTELVRQTVREGARGREPLYFSLPVTNVEDLCAPIPTPDGSLDNLLAAGFTGAEPKAIVWDEYNRPKDKAAFAKLMEITQEWSLAGRRIEGLRAQIAVQNPPYHLGRKLLVSRNNIAQATRFTASLTVEPDDIPANEWLIATYGRSPRRCWTGGRTTSTTRAGPGSPSGRSSG